jgi:hypothetical protein
MMNDDRKFRILAVLSTILVVSIISFNVFQEYFSTEFGSYLKRRIYYEKVLSGKGLPLHDAKHWRTLEK